MLIRGLLCAFALLPVAPATFAEEFYLSHDTTFDQPGATAGELPRSAPKWEDAGPEFEGCRATAAHRYTGFIDLNYYWDTRAFNTLTINAGANLPHDFEYFQFLNLDSTLGQASDVADLEGFYTEIHLRRPIAKDSVWLKPLDWTLTLADGTGIRDVQRLGVRWRTHDTPGVVGDFLTKTLGLEYSLDLHFLESDGSGIQLEHAYRKFFFDKRAYISGFADHDVNQDGSQSWVTEHQVGVRLIKEWYAVAEYRFNEFLPDGRHSGWGLGVEYLILFK